MRRGKVIGKGDPIGNGRHMRYNKKSAMEFGVIDVSFFKQLRKSCGFDLALLGETSLTVEVSP